MTLELSAGFSKLFLILLEKRGRGEWYMIYTIVHCTYWKYM